MERDPELTPSIAIRRGLDLFIAERTGTPAAASEKGRELQKQAARLDAEMQALNKQAARLNSQIQALTKGVERLQSPFVL
jgi:peptidoglycan hydrolase CwlO-like protein